MANDGMYEQMSAKPGFIAALDQSGGSTPGALHAYGIADSAWYDDEAEMFELMHADARAHHDLAILHRRRR